MLLRSGVHSSDDGPGVAPRAAAPRWIADSSTLAAELEACAAADVLAIDSESNGMYAYYERVCLLQISRPDADLLVDALAVDLGPVAAVLADPRIVKVLHAADNDIAVLGREFGIGIVNVFDTMLAARMLGWPAAGLGDVLERSFGHRADKRWQKSDWSQRPLPAAALAYAADDTRFLPALRTRQLAELAAVGKLELFEHACARMSRRPPTGRPFVGDGWRRLPESRNLPAAGRAVLHALWGLREDIARRLDRAPYRVLGNDVLVALARTRPGSVRGLAAMRGVGGPIARPPFATRIVATIARAAELEPPAGQPAPRSPADVSARFDALRAWRKRASAELGVDPDVLVGKDVLARLAERRPTELAALAGDDLLDAFEHARYGAAILAVLQRG